MADARRVLAFVLAGGEGSRLRPLTTNHAKPAIPLVDDIRIVDFVLANLVNSGVSTIYMLAQYKPASLVEHVNAAWAPLFGGAGRSLRIVLPNPAGNSAAFTGTADAVHKNLELIESHCPDLVAVFSAGRVDRAEAHVQTADGMAQRLLPVNSTGRISDLHAT